jgi:hypothetical protein
MATKKKPSAKQLAARAKFAAMARARAKAAKGKKRPVAKKVTAKKTTTKKINAIYYYGEGKKVYPTDLKIGAKYEWIAGAGYQEVTYIGKASQNPNRRCGTRLGVGGYIFEFDDGSCTNISAGAVSQNIRTIPAKKVTGTKSRKTPARKKPATTSRHKDTNSHNVRINVLSGPNIKRCYGVGKINDNKILTEIARESKLKKDVIAILKRKVADYDGNYQSLFNDIMRAGLQSGIIGDLVYYSDTIKWFKKHNAEISKMLREMMFEYGVDSPAELFGNKWDKSDPFASDTQNQNLLAWYSFETIVDDLQNRMGYND